MLEESLKSAPTMGEPSKKDVLSFQITGDSILPQITTVKFDGSNYLTWSKSILIYVQGKDNEDYLTGKVERPKKNDPRYWKWKIENAMMTS